jgi:hypothetical protein
MLCYTRFVGKSICTPTIGAAFPIRQSKYTAKSTTLVKSEHCEYSTFINFFNSRLKLTHDPVHPICHTQLYSRVWRWESFVASSVYMMENGMLQ